MDETNGVKVFLLNLGNLPFAGFELFESMAFQALAKGDLHAAKCLDAVAESFGADFGFNKVAWSFV